MTTKKNRPELDPSKYGGAPLKGDDNKASTPAASGLGYNGEFRVGKITLAVGGDQGLRLRHENVGTETEVSELLVEGVLEDAFFKRRIDEDGTARTGEATKA